jgi:hypothetical protein
VKNVKYVVIGTKWHMGNLGEGLMKFEEAQYEITEQCKDALDLYVSHGVPPGHFLTAVICNDLLSACNHADHMNITRIPEYVKYLFNEVPGNCWGSTEAMQTWMEKFK